MANISAQEAEFINNVAGATGLDPRVMEAWAAGEGHPGDEAWNYWNITASTARSLGIQPSGELAPASNPTAAFPDPKTGEQATIAEIKSLGLGNEGKRTPRQQIADIAASPWASSHYGGPGGPNLVADFESLFPSANLDGPPMKGAGQSGGGITGAVTGAVGAVTGAAGDATSGLESAVTGPFKAIAAPFVDIANFFDWFTKRSNEERMLLAIGGGILVLGGLYLALGAPPVPPIPIPV